ncbi:MAG: DNA translocase FtsK, partial [Thermoguttaceae bacterium]
ISPVSNGTQPQNGSQNGSQNAEQEVRDTKAIKPQVEEKTATASESKYEYVYETENDDEVQDESEADNGEYDEDEYDENAEYDESDEYEEYEEDDEAENEDEGEEYYEEEYEDSEDEIDESDGNVEDYEDEHQTQVATEAKPKKSIFGWLTGSKNKKHDESESSAETYEHEYENESESSETDYENASYEESINTNSAAGSTSTAESNGSVESVTGTRRYSLPSVELLTPPEPFDYENYESTVKRQAKLLERAFFNFGFNVRVVEIQTGPVIAQFEIQLEKGLRLNKILGLTDDLAIALKVSTVRIVAPIPGKNTVGIEIPNENRQLVRLREVIEETHEKSNSMHIPVYLGQDVTGNPMVIDLTKLPHLLIAGRTGTGKSVCLNSLIVSMLMTRTPDEVRMILIDPKMVELSPYKTIPHLMHPVVTDMRKAEAILAWAVTKMEERYQLLARAGVRQLSEFNKLSEAELYKRLQPESEEEWLNLPHSLPYMVIVADEMADLMMSSAKEVETHIIRLAQKSRAVGIHLVLATQKPTVDILTGLIKSNLPARIAFEVASRSDSQVVLDRNGAEKLLGNGDMLFLKPGTSQVIRGQGTYVSDAEIEKIIQVVGTDEPEYAEELVSLKIEGEEEESEETIKGGRDPLYDKAVEYVIREGRGSLSLLQRKFSVGYSRAARMIDCMAEEGIVGGYKGSQAREVTMSLSEWKRRQEELRAEEERAAQEKLAQEKQAKSAQKESRAAKSSDSAKNPNIIVPKLQEIKLDLQPPGKSKSKKNKVQPPSEEHYPEEEHEEEEEYEEEIVDEYTEEEDEEYEEEEYYDEEESSEDEYEEEDDYEYDESYDPEEEYEWIEV